MSDEISTDDNGRGNAPVVPSVTEMISASIGAPSNESETALDDLHIRITGAGTVDDYNAPRIEVRDPNAPRPRGRPRKDGTTGQISERVPAKKKSDLAADVARLESALAAEIARNNTDKVSELAKSIELACFLGFGTAAEMRNAPWWGMTEKEASEIGNAGAQALAPYAAQLATQLPWAVFVGVLGKAIYTRVQIDRRMIAQINSGAES